MDITVGTFHSQSRLALFKLMSLIASFILAVASLFRLCKIICSEILLNDEVIPVFWKNTTL